ncbi:MAG TPA: archease [Chloroflexota bacterium]|nr:archease [Chloroflexota bacterium]
MERSGVDPPMNSGSSRCGYAVLEHTADVGLRVWGTTPAEAFGQAARGMLAIIVGPDASILRASRPVETREVRIDGVDLVDLLVSWLSELLVLLDADGFLPIDPRIDVCGPTELHAWVSGYQLAENEWPGGLMIKAVTYHQARVDVRDDRVEAQVIFDI